MMLAEPNRTQYDLHFRIFGIPVRIHPLFWLVGVVLGYSSESSNPAAQLLICVAVIFVSILIHELGHALVMRRYGESPSIVLYMMGGLAISGGGGFTSYSSGRGRSSLTQIIISAAGPGAGFLLAGLTIAVAFAMRGITVSSEGVIHLITKEEAENVYLYYLTANLLFINIAWGIMNLLPIYPLDGGQISREIFLYFDPSRGIVRSLWLSVIMGALIAGLSLMYLGSFFMAMMFGMLAFSSYQILQAYSGRGGGGFGGRNPW